MPDEFTAIADLIKLPETTRGSRRLAEGVEAIFGKTAAERDDIGYLLTLHAACYLPRRKTNLPAYEHTNGPYSMLIRAGALWNARAREWIPQPLPYGGKPRALLSFVASYAKRHKTKEIPLGSSFTAFVREMAGSATGGAKGSLTLWKTQFAALAAADIRIGLPSEDGKSRTRAVSIATDIDVWFARTPGEATVFPEAVTLTDEYYVRLIDHAMPIDQLAFKYLQHDPLALDVYCWLTYRLPRVHEPNGCPISWHSLRKQFGPDYKEVRRFRRQFLKAIEKAVSVYPNARLEPKRTGLLIQNSPPAVTRRQSRVVKIADLAP